MSGGSADYNRYGAFFFFLLVLVCAEGHVEPLEVAGAGVEAGNSEFIGISSEYGTPVSFEKLP